MFVPWFFSARNNRSLLLSPQVLVISLLWHAPVCCIENTRNIYTYVFLVVAYAATSWATLQTGTLPSSVLNHQAACSPSGGSNLQGWETFALPLCLASPPCAVALLTMQMCNPPLSLPAASAGDAASYIHCCSYHPHPRQHPQRWHLDPWLCSCCY